MYSYLFILCICLVPFYMIIRDSYLFTRGQYNPYIFRKKKQSSFIILIIALGTYMGIKFLITDIRLLNILVYSFVFVSIFLLASVNILSYLSFNKTKDQKIIPHTVIANLIIIIILYILLHFVTIPG